MSFVQHRQPVIHIGKPVVDKLIKQTVVFLQRRPNGSKSEKMISLFYTHNGLEVKLRIGYFFYTLKKKMTENSRDVSEK